MLEHDTPKITKIEAAFWICRQAEAFPWWWWCFFFLITPDNLAAVFLFSPTCVPYPLLGAHLPVRTQLWLCCIVCKSSTSLIKGWLFALKKKQDKQHYLLQRRTFSQAHSIVFYINFPRNCTVLFYYFLLFWLNFCRWLQSFSNGMLKHWTAGLW